MFVRISAMACCVVLMGAFWSGVAVAQEGAGQSAAFSGGDHDPALDVLVPLLGKWRAHEQLMPVENMSKQTYGTETAMWAMGGKALKIDYEAEGDGIKYESVTYITHDAKRDRLVLTMLDTMSRPRPVVAFGHYDNDKKEFVFEVPSVTSVHRLEQRIVIRLINPQMRERVVYQITDEADQERIHTRYQRAAS